ncbi:MAG TPA: hypothetical protein VGK06_13910 [Methanosarcina sp.]|jgi:hypothetical protein
MNPKVLSLLLIFVICNIGIVAASSDNTVPANATIVKNLPSEKTVMDVLNNSTAQNYSEIEHMIVKNNWHGDRYNLTFEKIYDDNGVVVNSTDNLTMDVIYTNNSTGNGGYGRIGVLAERSGIYLITPEPFAIGKSVLIESLKPCYCIVTTPIKTAEIAQICFGNKNKQEILSIKPETKPIHVEPVFGLIKNEPNESTAPDIIKKNNYNCSES